MCLCLAFGLGLAFALPFPLPCPFGGGGDPLALGSLAGLRHDANSCPVAPHLRHLPAFLG